MAISSESQSALENFGSCILQSYHPAALQIKLQVCFFTLPIGLQCSLCNYLCSDLPDWLNLPANDACPSATIGRRKYFNTGAKLGSISHSCASDRDPIWSRREDCTPSLPTQITGCDRIKLREKVKSLHPTKGPQQHFELHMYRHYIRRNDCEKEVFAEIWRDSKRAKPHLSSNINVHFKELKNCTLGFGIKSTVRLE
ncbi:unnamed protein product [Protopolystoma xenopodis]|uniref:Uncharacterized protein n=1 Tax=Protopolystoma xenopodis TaxID=117903 RepID=A0A3S5AL34_9PLAT|nr:unnamed protein product [Protopolystoma xenopodis]